MKCLNCLAHRTSGTARITAGADTENPERGGGGGVEETDDAVLHHSGSICDQTGREGGPRRPLNPPLYNTVSPSDSIRTMALTKIEMKGKSVRGQEKMRVFSVEEVHGIGSVEFAIRA